MKFPEMPDKIFGKDIDGAIERVLSKQKDEPQEKPKQRNISAPDLKGFIHIPSIRLYVSKERILQNKNWYQAHEELQKQDSRMLTPSEFIEFLKYTRDNHLEVYEDIIAMRKPLRGEWLDVRFEDGNNHQFDCNGRIAEV